MIITKAVSVSHGCKPGTQYIKSWEDLFNKVRIVTKVYAIEASFFQTAKLYGS